MTSYLATGYFIWNVPVWIFIVLATFAIFAAIIFAFMRGCGGWFVGGRRGSTDSSTYTRGETYANFFMRTYIAPWSESRYAHILAPLVLLLLLLTAVFVS